MEMSIDEAITNLESLQKDYQDFHDEVWKDSETYSINAESLNIAIETMRKYQQLEDFARWVATEVIDEEMWTYNHLSFAELACRKLVQLGIMQESDGEYSYEVVEDGNNRA